MPAHISHAIMAKDLYNKMKKDNDLLKIDILQNELQGYSLGIDLSITSFKMKSDPHTTLTKEFFINIIKYIKENKLQENIHVISLLYGHIAHYYLDVLTHPLIYYIDKGTKKTSIIPNHNLIEGYLNSYLTTKILNKDIMEITPDYFNQIDLSNQEIKKLLNTVYGSLYNDYNMIAKYKRTISIFTKIEQTFQKSKLSKEKLIKLSRFDKYLEKNNLTLDEITNEEHLIYTNPVTGEEHNESFLDLYNKSLEMTLDALIIVNKYLYNSMSVDILDNVFQGISYDTGLPCSNKNKMQYVRKLKK